MQVILGYSSEWYPQLHPAVRRIALCSSSSEVNSGLFLSARLLTFTFMHLADAFIQSDLQLHSGYTFLSVYVFPGNRTHNLLRCWHNALPLSHTGTLPEIKGSRDELVCLCRGDVGVYMYACLTWMFRIWKVWSARGRDRIRYKELRREKWNIAFVSYGLL